MSARRFAIAFGVVFLVVGIAGFVPGLLQPHEHPGVAINSFMGLLFGMFAVNVLHNLVHVLFGVWGLAASGSHGAAKTYAKAVAIIYAVLMVMGLLPFMNLNTMFGLTPLYGHDIWLHAGLAAVAAYFGFRSEHDHAMRSA